MPVDRQTLFPDPPSVVELSLLQRSTCGKVDRRQQLPVDSDAERNPLRHSREDVHALLRLANLLELLVHDQVKQPPIHKTPSAIDDAVGQVIFFRIE